MTFPFPYFRGMPGAASTSLTANTTSNTATSSYSFTSQSIGADDPTRLVVVAVNWYNGQAVSDVSIGGISATKVSDPGTIAGSTGGVSWWVAKVPTGSSVTVQVTFTSSVTRCGIGVFRVVGIQSATPVRTTLVTGSGNPLNTSINVPSGSVVLGAASIVDGSGAGSYTWAGLTEQYDQLIGGASVQTGASVAVSSPTAALSISATYSRTPDRAGMLNVIALR